MAPLVLFVAACDDDVPASGPEAEAGGGGGMVTGGGGVGGQDGATGGGGSNACADCSNIETTECFCAAVDGQSSSMCPIELTIDDVLQPTCPGPLVYPISASCQIGGVFYPFTDLTFDIEEFFFDRDSGELVGLRYGTDVDICGSELEVSWGITEASCELCDPCGVDPDHPPCPS